MRGSPPVLLVLMLASAAFGQRPPVRTFDGEQVGQPPQDFEFSALRQPSPGNWTVELRGGGPVLRHAPDPTTDGWSVAVVKGASLGQVLVSARVRLSSGTRAGGVVWRYRDSRNFYTAVLDLDNQRISAYRVTDGNRVRFDVRDGLELDAGAWYTLKIVHEGTRVYVWLGGIRVLTDEDPRHGREESGRAGLLAAGGADARFDDLRVEPRQPRHARPRR